MMANCARFQIVVLAALLLHTTLPAVVSADTLLVEGPSGGEGGQAFSDLHPGAEIAEISVRAGAFIDGVGLVYRVGKETVAGPWHGGQGGSPSRFKLGKNEHITEIGGKTGAFVDSLWIRTNKGRSMSWGGNGGARKYRYKAPPGGRVAGLWGRSGDFIDAIGPAFAIRGTSVAAGNLDGFAEVEPDAGAAGGDKADTIQAAAFPQPASSPGSHGWLEELGFQLQAIVRKLAGSKGAFTSYEKKEHAHCGADLHCQIWFRQGAIAYVVGGQ